jgi:hypothetical protein
MIPGLERERKRTGFGQNPSWRFLINDIDIIQKMKKRWVRKKIKVCEGWSMVVIITS